MKINYNVSAMLANNALAQNDTALSKSLERLSSGLKINHAKDNAAGLAIAKRMNAQIEGLSVANQNASDGVSIVEIADGALSEVHDMLQRMNELSIKGATGTITDDDRKMIDEELQQLKKEITRIGETTQFNGQNLLDGSFDLKGYSDNKAVKVETYNEEVPVGKYEVSVTPAFDADGKLVDGTTATITGADGNTWTGTPEVSIENNMVVLKGEDSFEVRLSLAEGVANAKATIDLTGIGSMTMQIGANEGQTLEIRIPKIGLKQMGIEETEVTTGESADKAIEEIKGAITYVSSVRSRLGAYQNRLEHTNSSLDITSENMTSAYSRIMDVDMATEMTKYSSMQVISQAATSMLAQANERPSQVLQLLQ